MGLQLVCDECGAALGELDRVQVTSSSLDEGSVLLDLCFTCGDSVRKAAPVAKKLKAQKEKVEKARAHTPGPPPVPVDVN